MVAAINCDFSATMPIKYSEDLLLLVASEAQFCDMGVFLYDYEVLNTYHIESPSLHGPSGKSHIFITTNVIFNLFVRLVQVH